MNKPISTLIATLICGLVTAPAFAADPPAETAKAEKSAKPDPTDGRATALAARMTVKVIHPDEVRAELTKLVKKSGGFVTLVTDYALHIKLPPGKLAEVMKAASAKGAVLDKHLTRTDLTESIAQLQGKVRSKTEIMQRLRGFVDDSNVRATLTIEREMTRLVRELEQVKGQLRVQQDQARWATLQISFRYRKRGRVKYVRSPFKWLNSVDLDRFLRSF